MLGVAVRRGLGSNTTSAVALFDGQPLAVAITVKVTVWFAAVVLFKIPAIVVLEPEPLTPGAFTVLSLDQLKVVPEIPLALLNTKGVIVLPPHKVCVTGETEIVGFGFTVIVVLDKTV